MSINHAMFTRIDTVLRRVLAAVAICCYWPSASGQEPATPEHPNIIESFTSDTLNILVLPDGLDERLEFQEPKKGGRPADARAGYRVQIFSDGNQTTARNGARARIRQVSARFPQYRTYLDYKSPYWRARVGDFRNRNDANEAAAALRKAFPAFSKEIRVVSDRISILDKQ